MLLANIMIINPKSLPSNVKVISVRLLRITNPRNIRVFYVYIKNDEAYGIYAYEKKSQKIPGSELNHARKILKLMR